MFACLHSDGSQNGDDRHAGPRYAADLAAATESARALAHAEGLQLEDFASWRALDLTTNFIRLANAGDLAFADIPVARAAHYALLARALEHDDAKLQRDARQAGDATPDEWLRARYQPLLAIMRKLANGAPSRTRAAGSGKRHGNRSFGQIPLVPGIGRPSLKRTST